MSILIMFCKLQPTIVECGCFVTSTALIRHVQNVKECHKWRKLCYIGCDYCSFDFSLNKRSFGGRGLSDHEIFCSLCFLQISALLNDNGGHQPPTGEHL